MPDRSDEKNENDTRDILLIRETLLGDDDAFAGIVQAYSPQLLALTKRHLSKPDDAEEAVQDIFFKVFRALAGFRLESRFHPWLFTIAINHLRSLNRRRRIARLLFSNRPVPEAVPRGSAAASDPAQALIEQEGRELLRRAELRLNDRRRSIYLLHHRQGLPLATIAEILHLPEGTIKTELFRARRQLAILLEDYRR